MNKTMKVFVFCLALFLPLSSHGRPDDKAIEGFGVMISACFHPTASYGGIDLPHFPSPNDNKQEEGSGKIWFYGATTGNTYYMSFIMQTRVVNNVVQFRVIPQTDTAPFPPNPACVFLDWYSF